MSIDRRTLMGGALGLGIASAAPAQESPYVPGPGTPKWPASEQFRLWPGKAPGAPATLPKANFTMNGSGDNRQLWLRGIADPVVAVYRPPRPDGRAVLSIPGGGYGFLSVQNEGLDVANALNPHGITVFTLIYRLPGEGWANRWDVPLQDAQRAMRLIRARADNWQIDPAKLGILGFSAGGHLGASLTVGHDDKVYAPIDAADRQSARPAYSGLIYPVIDFDKVGTHSGSKDNLLGANPPAEVVARYNTDSRITAETPPIFLVHAFDDDLVGIDQSLNVIAACRKAKVPVEAHLLEKGGHGFGARHLPGDSSGRLWTELFARWTATH